MCSYYFVLGAGGGGEGGLLLSPASQTPYPITYLSMYTHNNYEPRHIPPTNLLADWQLYYVDNTTFQLNKTKAAIPEIIIYYSCKLY